MRSRNKSILKLIIYFLVISCTSSDTKTRKIIFYTEDNSSIEVTEFEFKTYQGGFYFHINDNSKEDMVVNKAIINKIDFVTNDTIYHCLPYEMLSSRLNKSTFDFAVKRKTHRIQYYLFDKEIWFLIGNDEQFKLLK